MTTAGGTPAAGLGSWLPNILSFGFLTLLLRRKIPLLASLKLTYRCNLRCRACPYHLRAEESGSHMSWELALEAMKKLKKLGCRFVIFEGGEPLLWIDGEHDFSALAVKARKLFLRVGATTNGTLPLNVPTDLLWVSLDGARKRHDQLRGDSFDRAMGNIRQTAHPRLFIHYTINRENVDDIPLLVRDLSGVDRVRGITFQFFYPYGQGEEELTLGQADRKRAVDLILELKRSGVLPVLNSSSSLKRMVENDWTCRPWLLANVDPDGQFRTGCYVLGRGEVRCGECGFTPVAEVSRAYALHPGALLAGWRIFLKR